MFRFRQKREFEERYQIARYVTETYGVYTIPEDITIVVRREIYSVIVEDVKIFFYNDDGHIYEMQVNHEIQC